MTVTSVADLWRGSGFAEVTDDLVTWPPDVIALTEVTLEHSEAYRFVVSPPSGRAWPPATVADWPTMAIATGTAWAAWAVDAVGPPPPPVAAAWATVLAGGDTPVADVADGSAWPLVEALLVLHAVADEACAGLGGAVERPGGGGAPLRGRGSELLARTGSLARLARPAPRVLPKVRTPPGGISMRSLSRYVVVRERGVAATWHKVPAQRGPDPRRQQANLLLLPWPERLTPRDFAPVQGSLRRAEGESFAFFEYAPREPLDLDLVDRLLLEAIEDSGTVDVVMLPEGAVAVEALAELEAVLARRGVGALVTGVRERAPDPDTMPDNWVHIGVRAQGRWFHYRQNKHHRWSLDESQIRQYHLGGALHPLTRWWEAMRVPSRSVQFVELSGGITLAAVICEDLARIDAVADLVRSVGPTLVITVLLDGPQLASRWTSRYAGVLADDPGSAVLTLSALGMVERSRPDGAPASRVIALWKDPDRGAREISVEPGAHGVVVTTVADRATRHTADGRSPSRDTTRLLDVAVHSVRGDAIAGAIDDAAAAASGADTSSWAIELDTIELSIWAGWTEAWSAAGTAEERAAVRAAADPAAGWRAPLGLPAPSGALAAALARLGEPPGSTM